MELARRRELVDQMTYDTFYQADAEIVVMLGGLMEAEYRKEKGENR